MWQLPLAFLIQQSPAQSLMKRLDPDTRARVLAALGALILLGLFMMALAWWGARFARRYANRDVRFRPGAQPRPLAADDWATRPMVDSDATPDRADE